MLHQSDKCIGVMCMVTKNDWATICQDVKNQCISIAKKFDN